MDNISPTTHRTGYGILNEFFGEPGISPEPMSDVKGPSKWPVFTAESPRDKVLKHTVRSNTPEALNTPQRLSSTGISAVSSNASDMLDPDLSMASAATSESGSSGSI